MSLIAKKYQQYDVTTNKDSSYNLRSILIKRIKTKIKIDEENYKHPIPAIGSLVKIAASKNSCCGTRMPDHISRLEMLFLDM
jgi:hypothetical protein